MTRRSPAVCAVVATISLLAVPHRSKAAEQQGRTLQVQVDYTGSGKVDQTHKIFAVLWDTPDFVQGHAMPVELKSGTKKDDVITFTGVQKVPAYISVAFDPSGSWDGQSGPPPAGSSLGMYSKGNGVAEPIDIPDGKTVTVKVTFDDSIKMQ